MGKVAETLGSGLITGPATIVSGIMQSRAQNKATDASERSNAAALAFTKEQEAQRKAVYDQRMAQWTASRNALLQRYGIDIAPPSTAPAGPAPGPVTMPQPGPATAVTGQPGLQGATLGEIMQRKQEAPGLDSWNDWQSKGLA